MKLKKNLLVGLSFACAVSIALASTSQNLNAGNVSTEKNITKDNTLAKANEILAKIEENKQNIVAKAEKNVTDNLPRAERISQILATVPAKVLEKETNEVKEAKAEVEKCVNVNTCDTARLKLAVAKLIDKVSVLETRVSNLESSKKINAEKDMKASKAIEKYKEVCVDKKVYIPGKIEESYVKFKKPRIFRAGTTLTGYNTPELTGAILEEKAYRKGEKIVADMWTYAGWIHDKNKNMWVRGFKLKPIFNQKKPPKHSVFYKIVKDCKKVKVQ